ncbi:histone-like protein [Shouchella miscanthi]|uniref:histone-like protein n=1 Tax=Shouchella miscanthi TaxID=2598861 RepID=UPI001AEE1948|nr:histone-like protein [Shouchella miscanthi]
MSEIENDNIKEENRLITVTALNRFTKNVSNIDQVKMTKDAKHLLIDQLEQITTMIFRRAEEICKANGRKTVNDEHLETAYEELMKPQEFLENIIDKLDSQKEELKTMAADKSLIRFMEE